MAHEINTKNLTYNPKTKVFSGEVSDTVGLLTSNKVFLISERTGAFKGFSLVKEHRDRENDITHFQFEARASEFTNKSDVLTLVLFND